MLFMLVGISGLIIQIFVMDKVFHHLSDINAILISKYSDTKKNVNQTLWDVSFIIFNANKFII